MNTENSVTIRGDLRAVYAYAANVENWPAILPHYRSVQIIEPGDGERMVSMYCVRSFGFLRLPCKWRARQKLLPEEGRILYSHVSGPAQGMEVEWKLTDRPTGVETTIHHQLNRDSGWLRRVYSDWIVGPLFVQSIASRTLATIKRLVEAGVKP
jgi:ribosome-associated toxin RatA of RatAB toxin-antitoxin module